MPRNNSPKPHGRRSRRRHHSRSRHSNKDSSSSRSSSSDRSRSRSRSRSPPRHHRRGGRYRDRKHTEKRKRMTSEERREAEERERQARVARARMLTLLEKDEDDETKDQVKVPNGKAKETSPERHVEKPTDQIKEFVPEPPPPTELKITPLEPKGNDNNHEKFEIAPEPMVETSQELLEAKPAALSTDTKQIVSSNLEYVPERDMRPVDEVDKESPKVEPLPPLAVEPRGKVKKKVEMDNGLDPLDAFMAGITSNFAFSNRKDESEKAINEVEAKDEGVDGNKVITLEEIMNLGQTTTETAPMQVSTPEMEDDKYYSDFMAKLRETAKAIGVKEADVETLAENEVPLKTPQISKEPHEIRIYNDDDDAYLLELEKDLDDDDFLSRQKRQAEKKELKPVNHEEVEYEPFRKNFYIEVPEISHMTEKEVKAMRKAMGGINIRGQGCPKPVQNWYQCGLSDKVLEVIEKKGFKEMFPVQAQAIPAIMSGKDVIAIAETGSGKTLAYVLPMLRHVLDRPLSKEGEGPIALVIAPTRELATQIHSDIKAFTKALGLRSVCVYGGAGMGTQLSDLKRGCEIVVCTPGRMIDVLTTSNGKITNLKRVTYVVLDEADRMLDLGFEPQISRLLANIRPDRQAIMCSATFPKQIENLARKALQRPIEIVVGNRGQACKNVDQIIEVREEDTKFRRLLEILGEWGRRGSILIFVDKQEQADTLFKDLFNTGYRVLVLHGGQDQTDREFTIADFKQGVRNIMVATSLAARGLDIKHVTLVINYSCPNHAEDYVHRVGRTGRAGNKGVAITFITPDECQYASEIIKALKLSSQEVPESLEELDRAYRQKVDKGEMEKYKPKGFMGSGYKFNPEEKYRMRVLRKQLSASFGFDMEASDSETELDIKEGTKKGKKEEEEKSREQIITERIKDPRVKQAAMDAAISAAKIAIVNGCDLDGIRKAAEFAINKIIEEYKPTVSLKEGLERVLQLRDDFEAQEDRKNNRVSADFEINDYPQVAKNKVSDREFASRIYEGTGCAISIRGINVEIGKNPPSGQRRLYVHIEGETKQDVQNAHQEIKRVLEEEAGSAMSTHGYTGAPGRYTVP